MDYGIENTTHDKAYFDETDREAEKEIWLENRTAEIAEEIALDNHPLYRVLDCIIAAVIEGENEVLRDNFCSGLRSTMTSQHSALKYTLEEIVEKQARILAEGELAAMENEDDY